MTQNRTGQSTAEQFRANLSISDAESESERVKVRPSMLSAALHAHTNSPGLSEDFAASDSAFEAADLVARWPLDFGATAASDGVLPSLCRAAAAAALSLIHGVLSGMSSSDLPRMIPTDSGCGWDDR